MNFYEVIIPIGTEDYIIIDRYSREVCVVDHNSKILRDGNIRFNTLSYRRAIVVASNDCFDNPISTEFDYL